MGLSAETFWGEKDGAAEFEKFMNDVSGLNVTTGAHASVAALKVHLARKIGIITPYQEVGDKQVVDFFEGVGYEVHATKGLRCDSASSIAEVPPDVIKAAFREVNASDVDALFQAGTNLPAAVVAS